MLRSLLLYIKYKAFDKKHTHKHTKYSAHDFDTRKTQRREKKQKAFTSKLVYGVRNRDFKKMRIKTTKMNEG